MISLRKGGFLFFFANQELSLNGGCGSLRHWWMFP